MIEKYKLKSILTNLMIMRNVLYPHQCLLEIFFETIFPKYAIVLLEHGDYIIVYFLAC